jgi:hypothetical protein
MAGVSTVPHRDAIRDLTLRVGPFMAPRTRETADWALGNSQELPQRRLALPIWPAWRIGARFWQSFRDRDSLLEHNTVIGRR